MHFRIAPDPARPFSISYGQRGFELSAFVPGTVSWSQINYGQGEGQVFCIDCEWGFYIIDSGIDVHLHKGTIALESAVSFVRAVQEHVFGNKGVPSKILLIDDDESA